MSRRRTAVTKKGERMKRLALALALGAVLAAPVEGSTILVTTEAGITADGLIDWSVLGPTGTAVANPFNVAVTGVAGLDATVSIPAGSFERLDQDAGWGGNFGAGEALLFTAFNQGPLQILFDGPVSGFGAQIQQNVFGAFTATIEAFDSGNNSLGVFNLLGDSNGNGDDSAIFIGILSNLTDIWRVDLNVSGNDSLGFAINGPRIQTVPVPEPLSLLLMGTGLAAFARRQYRHR